jgi:hypothetical protein
MILPATSTTDPPRVPYRRRRPEDTVLYQLVADHLETFLHHLEADPSRGTLPGFVEQEFRHFLRCGLLCHGFARFQCSHCGDDLLVAFSCKRRGFCPSCGARRMAESAAHLVDRVLAHVPVRQYVLTFPFPIRFLLAYNPELANAVRTLFVRTLFCWLRRHARRQGVRDARPGAVSNWQRAGSALNLNPHIHLLALDGFYEPAPPLSSERERPRFHELDPLCTQDTEDLLTLVRKRITSFLQREGHLPAEELATAEPALDEPDLFATLAAASIQGRVALGTAAGQPIPRIHDEALSSRLSTTEFLCVHQEGFSLHAATCIPASDRTALERLCRYIFRPPLANDRLSLTSEGLVVLKLPRAFRDGTRYLLFKPLVFLERLAALVPRPHINLTTYHGVLAPASSLRPQIVPYQDPGKEQSEEPSCSLRDLIDHSDSQEQTRQRCEHPRYYPWAELLLRMFGIDALRCHLCGGRRKLIALIEDAAIIQKILVHLGLPHEPPPIAPARAPPQPRLPFP